MTIKKEVSHKRLSIRTILHVIALKVYPTEKVKRPIYSICFSSSVQVMKEDISASNTSDTNRRQPLVENLKKTITSKRMLEKFLDKYNH